MSLSHCGYVEDRDINAAKNILKKARRAICSLALDTVGHTGTHASGDLSSGLVGAILLSDDESVNEESPRL
jgi:putative transposase